ncbi:MAG TPA: hypothetical protein P5200_08485 [Tenuifilaceae bacterium]|nr:hypothetical protein [Tenuifilaceae bacterium]HRX68394.1 hypothetical protein [Tenuifilaceae bacterium]
MYRQKSKIIEKIQSYHRQVAELFYGIYEKTNNKEVKTMVYELYEHEKNREEYLEKHKKIAEVIDCWLEFPCEKLSNQISECFEGLNTNTTITVKELLKLEVHFDNCLIKIFNILSSQDSMNETATNIFYYMLKKTKKEEEMLANMLLNSETTMRTMSN